MPAPKQADLNKPVSNRSRFSGRVVATRADNMPVWNNPSRSLNRLPPACARPAVDPAEVGTGGNGDPAVGLTATGALVLRTEPASSLGRPGFDHLPEGKQP